MAYDGDVYIHVTQPQWVKWTLVYKTNQVSLNTIYFADPFISVEFRRHYEYILMQLASGFQKH